VPATIEARNPRTGEVDYRIDPPKPAELKELAERLRSAQPRWEAAGVEGRAQVLGRWRRVLQERKSSLIDALVEDTGRLAESVLEVDAAASGIERWCRLGPEILAEDAPRPSSMPAVSIRQSMRPYPLVGVISPWNFPLLLSLIDAVPALVAGCAVIVKPSEVTPRFIDPLRESIAEVPELSAVFVSVPGAGETGESLIDLVDAVCFTGSVPTGRRVGEQASRRFIPAFLELGGKDPAIVLSSADLDRATSAILWGSTANAGQACQSIERVYVGALVFDDFVGMIVDKAEKLRLAVPESSSGEIGPIIAGKQVAVIRDHLADAKSKGASALCGGEVEIIDGGAYCRPTVLTGVDHSMLVMTEETFGPIMPVMRFDDSDEAVRLANDTTFGLSAAVFAGSVEEAALVGSRINAGAVSINDAALTALVHDSEKNSFNFSGLGGSRMGPAALRRFGRRQALLVSETKEPDLWWFPQLKEPSED
jgi:succinate-semialdehyde dehydrogenase/glutarate-semialdehyde dehydrogenase